MKKVIIILTLALIVAGGAFAQSVGSTVTVSGQNYRVESNNNGRLVLQLVPTLDGTWQAVNGTTVRITGTTGVFTQVSSGVAWQNAVRSGLISIGGPAFRNLTSTGNLTWSGQQLLPYYRSDPNVPEYTQWDNFNITMSADGRTFDMNNGNIWTRR